MQFSKMTKRKTVYGAGDGLAPITNVYIATEYLDSRDIETERVVVTVSDVPFSGDEAGRMLVSVPMRVSHTTKYKTVFTAVDTDAPVDSLYVVSEWLRSHDFGDVLYLGISDAATGSSGEDGQDGAAGSSKPESTSPETSFDTFLDEAVVRRSRSRTTTGHIWSVWASRYGVSPDRQEIGGILRRGVAKLFREHFSAPKASRARVDRRSQYYWEGYAIVPGEATVNVHSE